MGAREGRQPLRRGSRAYLGAREGRRPSDPRPEGAVAVPWSRDSGALRSSPEPRGGLAGPRWATAPAAEGRLEGRLVRGRGSLGGGSGGSGGRARIPAARAEPRRPVRRDPLGGEGGVDAALDGRLGLGELLVEVLDHPLEAADLDGLAADLGGQPVLAVGDAARGPAARRIRTSRSFSRTPAGDPPMPGRPERPGRPGPTDMGVAAFRRTATPIRGTTVTPRTVRLAPDATNVNLALKRVSARSPTSRC